MHQARLGYLHLLGQGRQAGFLPPGESNLNLSPKPMARPNVPIHSWTTPSLVSSSPTGSDSSARSSTDSERPQTPPVSCSSTWPTPPSTCRKLRGFYPRSALESTLYETYEPTADRYPESPYAFYSPESTSSLLAASPRTRAFALRRSGKRSLLGCASIVLGASWLAVVMFQRECRGRELVRRGVSSLVLVEQGASVLPVETSSTSGVAGTSEAEEDDESPLRNPAAGSRFVEQDPIIIRFPEDDLEDDGTYVRF